MKFFGHENDKGDVPIDDLREAQALSDPMVTAPQFINKTREDLRWGKAEPTHPWRATELTILRLGVAANAHAMDCLAEALLRNCGGGGEIRHGSSIGPVIDALTRHSQELMRDSVEGLSENQNGYRGVLAENIENLNPAVHLPRLPRARKDGATQEWQDPTASVVTTNFITSLVEAARTMQSEANDSLNYVTDETQTGLPVPPEQSATRGEIEWVIENADRDATEVEQALFRHRGAELPEGVRDAAYTGAYEAFFRMSGANVAANAPAMLGSDFLPEY